MADKSINIKTYLKHKPKACKRALIFNALIFIVLVYFTIKFLLLGYGDLQGSTKQITIGVGITMLFLDILTIFALRGFMQGNKLTKIYFMLLSVFGSVFAMGDELQGLVIMVFLIVALFVNVSCYSKLYPNNS